MVMVVFFGWLSFFIPRKAVPARIALVIIAFLSLSGMVNAIMATHQV